MNRFYINLSTPLKQDSPEYSALVDAMHKFMIFEIKDLTKAINKALPKGVKVERRKVVDTLRILIRQDLIKYSIRDQKMILNKTKTQKVKN